MALKDLTFSDIYLGTNGAWISGVPGTSDPVATPPDDLSEVLELRGACDQYRADNPEREDFPLRHGGFSL